jgi:uncharacterized protein YerC
VQNVLKQNESKVYQDLKKRNDRNCTRFYKNFKTHNEKKVLKQNLIKAQNVLEQRTREKITKVQNKTCKKGQSLILNEVNL